MRATAINCAVLFNDCGVGQSLLTAHALVVMTTQFPSCSAMLPDKACFRGAWRVALNQRMHMLKKSCGDGSVVCMHASAEPCSCGAAAEDRSLALARQLGRTGKSKPACWGAFFQENSVVYSATSRATLWVSWSSFAKRCTALHCLCKIALVLYYATCL